MLLYIIAGIFGLIIAALKVAIESGKWDKEKDERKFHGTGLALVFVALVVEYFITDYNWKAVVITWIIYWNTFEIVNNLYHDNPILYVGETAEFDKFLRGLTKYHERLKFFIQLTSIIVLTLIFISL